MKLISLQSEEQSKNSRNNLDRIKNDI